MNRTRRLVLALTVAAVLLVAISEVPVLVAGLAWPSAAAPATLAQAPDSRAGQAAPGAAAPSPDAPLPGGPAFLTVDPHAFHPKYSECVWGYYEGWKLYGECPFVAGVSLPNNVTINKLVVVFLDIWDLDGVNVDVILWRHDPVTMESVEMARITSSGGAEYPRYLVDESIVEPVVDQQQYTYSLEAVSPIIEGHFTMLLGVRIDYGYNVAVPLTMKNE
jgi:hypothetical protein